ncbi:hypothetical protein PENANT_c002G00362 [Penicillium antarcticum]|uniref:Uncharacterized protein n=1 Tax=Penicillium antarcticum TaxID=416450 RepID=A0A1V6QL34_9EURO|nr:hypothetical protein PENANT_c002G00362 [Penicillium antarcticum]
MRDIASTLGKTKRVTSRQVRCIFGETSDVCLNCQRHQWPCFRRERKRKRAQADVTQATRTRRVTWGESTVSNISPCTVESSFTSFEGTTYGRNQLHDRSESSIAETRDALPTHGIRWIGIDHLAESRAAGDIPSEYRPLTTVLDPNTGFTMGGMPQDMNSDFFHNQYPGMGDWLFKDLDWNGEMTW